MQSSSGDKISRLKASYSNTRVLLCMNMRGRMYEYSQSLIRRTYSTHRSESRAASRKKGREVKRSEVKRRGEEKADCGDTVRNGDARKATWRGLRQRLRQSVYSLYSYYSEARGSSLVSSQNRVASGDRDNGSAGRAQLERRAVAKAPHPSGVARA